MSTACCTFVKPHGDPCSARPLPDRSLCLIHDPGSAETLAAGRVAAPFSPEEQARARPSSRGESCN